ncbi:PTS sugar transporter subunit IIA [Salininema proteolyticum]|uniref:Ascorbate-specific PTS system EIIA component n=1 Tax=Salininema proteolyticum TaxID=1607685 RepID=A0ABV8TWA3_9ACTN
MSELSELLPPEAIRLDLPAADWTEAIKLAGELLTETGVASSRYTAEMIQNVHDNGPYIVIAPGLAFAHARPAPSVHRTGMSWVRLATPVAFGHKANDPVEIVVALAATDAGEHTGAMGALARLLSDPDKFTALREAATPGEVHDLLAGKEVGIEEKAPQGEGRSGDYTGSTDQKILTVCGNGVGTSLFLKQTLDGVLDRWGWSRYFTTEAADTISAKGKAKEAQAILTSGEIARTLGDVGVPVAVVQDFTSASEVDRVLRDLYDV